MRLYLSLLAVFLYGFADAQIRGAITDPAVLPNPMDPNGDGYITTTGAAFKGPLDEIEFELPFIPIPAYQPEPGPDNQVPSTSCTIYELVGDAANGAESSYYYYQDPDAIPASGDERIFFRSRVARLNGSGGLSILIDTDQKFGFTGPEQDPNAVVGNPGFELEISATTSSGSQIHIYNVDGVSNPTVIRSSYSVDTNLQIAYALNQDPDCSMRVPGFIDIYLPFSALGISSTANIRMVNTSSETTGSNLGGRASDIGGVDGNAIPGDDDQFIVAIGNYPSFSFQNGTNRPPSATDATLTLNENSVNATAVHTVSATDPNGHALSYTITAGNTGGAFAINSSGQISVSNAAALDFESTPSFSLTVRASDGTLFDDAIITINLNNVNEAPAATDATASLNENSANGTAVHTVFASDPDANALSYAISSGNTGTAFAITSSGTITVNNAAALDFETTRFFSLTVTVSDGTLSDDAVITINMNDVNEAPVATDATVWLNENSATATAVHTVSASDPDGNALSYAISAGNSGNAFAINSFGKITVNSATALDFESTPSFALIVTVSDGALSYDATLIINLNNVNEAPAATDATVSLNENSVNGTPVHTVFASDPDANALSYAITSGNTGTVFTITNSGAITVNNAAALDFETTTFFSLTVTVSDGTLSDDAVIAINLNDVNEAPVATDATVWLNENSAIGTAVHTVSAFDPDANPLFFDITSGNTGTAFAVNSSGEITVNGPAALDFESTPSFALIVTVSDGALSYDAAFTINLNDVNEAPFAADATVTLNENSVIGTAVHIVSASDPDDDVLSYAITAGNTGIAFLINSSGEITVNNATTLDFESNTSFSLIVNVSDGTLSDDVVITIDLKNVNEAPATTDARVFVNENSGYGTPVHTVSASDPDDDALTYTITGGNTSAAFAINSSGEITVNNVAALDFESIPWFSLTVKISDRNLSDDAVISIDLRDVNEPPYIGDAIISIGQDLPGGRVIHKFICNDPDSNDTAIFSIEAGNSNSTFILDESTGELSVNDIQEFELLENAPFELTIRVTDGGGLSSTAKLTIEVENVGEKIDIDPLKGFSPNGDGINDFWFIKGIEAYPDNEVKVFNRWGNLVFQTRNYDNHSITWGGPSNKNASETTYYFLISIKGLQPITGFVIMKE